MEEQLANDRDVMQREQQQQQHAQTAQMFREERIRARREKRDAIPENTNRSYKACQKHFLTFCQERFGLQPSPLKVSDQKLLLYLCHRQDQGKITKVMEHGQLVTKKVPLSYKTVDQIVSAVVSLYHEQVAEEQLNFGGNAAWAHPRSQDVKQFLQNYRAITAANNVATPNKDTDINEPYNQENLIDMVSYGIEKSSRSKTFVGTIAAMILSQSLLYKGDSLRNVDFTDLRYFPSHTFIFNDAAHPTIDIGSQEIDNQPRFGRVTDNSSLRKSSNRSAELLMIISRKSKTNQENNRTTVGCLRHANVLCCAQFWLAAYQVERFHVNNEDDIDFSNRESFFNLKLFTNFSGTADRNKPMNYQYHYENYKVLMQGIGIRPGHVTNGPRASGVQLCDSFGVPATDIEKFGMHHLGNISSSLLGRYVYNIPTGPLAVLAGGRYKDGMLKYSMSRDFVKPSDELKRKLFPFINDYLDPEYLREPGNINQPRSIEQLTEYDDKYENNTKQMAYLTAKVLDHLREVFIQDFKFLETSYEEGALDNIPAFNIPLFRSQEYLDFRAEQDRVYEEYFDFLNNPDESWKQQPDIISAFRHFSEIQKSQAETLKSQAQDIASLNQNIKELVQSMKDIQALLGHLDDSRVVNTNQSQAVPNSTEVQEPNVQSLPTFNFKKSPTTFQMIWNEYKYPCRGAPSIEQLDRQYSNKWRAANGIAKKYCRRNVIYKAITKGISKGFTESQCLKILEDARAAKSVSLTHFMDKKLVPDELK